MSKRQLRAKVRRLERAKIALSRELFSLQRFCNELASGKEGQ